MEYCTTKEDGDITSQSFIYSDDGTKQQSIPTGAFNISDEKQLERFLILGSGRVHDHKEANAIFKLNIRNVENMIQNGNGEQVVNILTTFSKVGRCIKQDFILVCLTICVMSKDSVTQQAASKVLPSICRIPSQLFMFLEMAINYTPAVQDYMSLFRTLGNFPLECKQQKTYNNKRKSSKKKKMTQDEDGSFAQKKSRNRSVGSQDSSPSQKCTAEGISSIVSEESALEKDTMDNLEETVDQVQDRQLVKSRNSVQKEKENLNIKDVVERKTESILETTKVASQKEKVDEGKNSKVKGSTFVSKHRKLIGSWYGDPQKSAMDLLYQMTKFKHRYTWDHKFLFHYGHIKIPSSDLEKIEKDAIITYCLKGYDAAKKQIKKFQNVQQIGSHVTDGQADGIDQEGSTINDGKANIVSQNLGKILECIEILKKIQGMQNYNPDTERETVEIIINSCTQVGFQITREHLPTAQLQSKKVWQALLGNMPMTAMLSNLANMSAHGVYEDEQNIELFKSALRNKERLKIARIHPIKILTAWLNYDKGEQKSYGKKHEKKTWNLNADICHILSDAFHLCFQINDEVHTNKQFMLCIDGSSSMAHAGYLGCDFLTPAMASVAMAAAIKKIEPNSSIYFCEKQMQELNCDISLTKLMNDMQKFVYSEGDLSLPIKNAMQEDLSVDVIILFTNATKVNNDASDPYKSFMKYKAKEGKAKLVVCALEANSSIIADPDDPSVFTVCGGDANLLNEIKTIIR